MRTFREFVTTRRGFNADGRLIGLGLAAAMDKQRQEATRGVENYLRDHSGGHSDGDRPVTSTTV